MKALRGTGAPAIRHGRALARSLSWSCGFWSTRFAWALPPDRVPVGPSVHQDRKVRRRSVGFAHSSTSALTTTFSS